jgi:biopolymer transport protein ExbB
MNPLIADAVAWWRGGDALMPVMGVVAVVLYAILIERSIALWSVRRQTRRDEVLDAMRVGAGDPQRLAWAAHYVGLTEADELARGVALGRALNASLPLLGLLGTVTGMVDTFGALSASGGQGAAQQAGAGIGLALTATQYGMALAIPAVLWDWALARRAAQLVELRERTVREAQGDAPRIPAERP